MNEVATNRTRFSYEGPLEPASAGLILAGLMVVFLWLLWRERNITGIATALLFFCLRSFATSIVLWMTLAATSTTVDRNETPRTVLIATDVSPSMTTIDNGDSVDDLRWALTADPASRDSSPVRCDRALAAVIFARQRIAGVTESIEPYRAVDDARSRLSRCSESLARATQHLQAVLDQTADPGREQTISEIIERLEQAHADLQTEIGSWNGAPGLSQIDRLTDIEDSVAGIEQRVRRLSVDVFREYQVQQGGELLATAKDKTRLSRVAGIADLLRLNLRSEPGSQANIRRILFDNRAWQLSDDASPRQVAAAVRVDGSSLSGGESLAVTTDLSVALTHMQDLDLGSPAAIVMFTDAAHNATNSRSPWDVAADLLNVPVHIVPIGSVNRLRDIVLYSVVAPPVVMSGDDMVIEAHVRAIGCAGESSVVELLRDGEPIDYDQVRFDADTASGRVIFNTTMAEEGTFDFEIRARGVEAEQSDTNNSQKITVEVTRRHVQVLLADGSVRWEFNYLRQLFRRDESVACDELVFAPRVRGTGALEADPRLPSTVDEWGRYDVVILGDIPADRFPKEAQQSLDDFISKRGGTAVIIAGDRYMPAAYSDTPVMDLLPTTKQALGRQPDDGYRLLLTSSGRRHQALMIGGDEVDSARTWGMVSRNVPIYSLSEYSQPKPAAETLIEAVENVDAQVTQESGKKAFLCWQPVGRGRVVYLSSPDTWRLRFRRGDQLHHRFWGQLLRWAIAQELNSGSELVQIRASRSHYEADEPIEVNVSLADRAGNPLLDATVSVIANPGDRPHESLALTADGDIPGRYIGQFTGLEPGDYTLEPTGKTIDTLLAVPDTERPTVSVTVRPLHYSELLDTRCRLDIAQKIADASGGQVLPPTVLEEIIELTDLQRSASNTMESRPVWPQWKYLWIVFVCLTTEWGIRKLKGMP